MRRRYSDWKWITVTVGNKVNSEKFHSDQGIVKYAGINYRRANLRSLYPKFRWFDIGIMKGWIIHDISDGTCKIWEIGKKHDRIDW